MPRLNLDTWIEDYEKCKSTIINLLAYAKELKAERDALSNGLTCFSCKVIYTEENKNEPCPQAHRSHWTHEWVSKRELDLTSTVYARSVEIERLGKIIAGMEPKVRAVERFIARITPDPNECVNCRSWESTDPTGKPVPHYVDGKCPRCSSTQKVRR